MGVDPGGSSLPAGEAACKAEKFGFQLDVVNQKLDPRFAFMTVDYDGKIRMDCSSPWRMAVPVKTATCSIRPGATIPTPTATASLRGPQAC